jgi:hypothetical protein
MYIIKIQGVQFTSIISIIGPQSSAAVVAHYFQKKPETHPGTNIAGFFSGWNPGGRNGWWRWCKTASAQYSPARSARAL